MGNAPQRGSRAAGGVPVGLELSEAILLEDRVAIYALLQSHPVDQPLAMLAGFSRYRSPLNQMQSVAPIHLAAEHHRAQSLLCLLEHGADPETRDTQGLTALHRVLLHWPLASPMWAKPGRHRQRAPAQAQQSALACLQILCEHGARVNARVDSGSRHSPLHLAVTYGTCPVLTMLAQRGARVNATDSSSMTPLHVAANSLNQGMMETLIACGADVNQAMSATGSAALQLAVCVASSKAGRLLAAGLGCIRLLLAHGARVNAQDHEGRAAMHAACWGGRKAVIDLLLESGASVNTLTRRGESPVYKYLERGSNIRDRPLLGRLLQHTHPLQLTNAQGTLPAGLLLPEFQLLRETLMRESREPASLEDICQRSLRSAGGEKQKQRLKELLPGTMWLAVAGRQDAATP
ncbi:ankyrin repeat domain-containing protein 61 [Sorex araneus]|uniref:ankyrin repeat domain-containing protein 61 n=1 Tax=Sorex araneus TaxID=42254 RepID=UPI002433C1AF|nr:ankyrin repeat domain-containing protein 61 [Sorex araneus]